MQLFGGLTKTPYLCIAFQKRALSSAGLEHLPYKQRVGGSNPSAPTEKEGEGWKKVAFDATFFCIHLTLNHSFLAQNAIGPWPMQLVVPSAVRAAVMMLASTCRMVFQVSFFIASEFNF